MCEHTEYELEIVQITVKQQSTKKVDLSRKKKGGMCESLLEKLVQH